MLNDFANPTENCFDKIPNMHIYSELVSDAKVGIFCIQSTQRLSIPNNML